MGKTLTWEGFDPPYTSADNCWFYMLMTWRNSTSTTGFCGFPQIESHTVKPGGGRTNTY